MQNQNNNKIIAELHPKELALVMAIRDRFRYGSIELLTRDGLPYRIIKAMEFDDLSPLGEDSVVTTKQ